MSTPDLQINCLALILPLDLVFLCFIEFQVLCLNACDQLLLDYNAILYTVIIFNVYMFNAPI